MFHDPLASIHTEHSVFEQSFLLPWQFPSFVAFSIVRVASHPQYQVMIWYNALYLFAACIVAAHCAVNPRLPLEYKALTVLVILTVTCRSSVMSIPRILMTAFPLYMGLADWCAASPARRAPLLVSLFVVLDITQAVVFFLNGPCF
jgi:hypothetical protein